MGRRNLARAIVIAAVLALFAGAAVAATRTTTLRWVLVAHGVTEPNGTNRPSAHLALSRRQETLWLSRTETRHRAAVTSVDFSTRAVIAVFLDGLPCTGSVQLGTVTRAADTLTVHAQYSPPPIGMDTCVRMSTPYFVLTVSRAALGTPAPAHVRVRLVVRARA